MPQPPEDRCHTALVDRQGLPKKIPLERCVPKAAGRNPEVRRRGRNLPMLGAILALVYRPGSRKKISLARSVPEVSVRIPEVSQRHASTR